jgi:hypothetical protein
LNFGHLYFDIVSNFVLRISDFASLGISTLVERALQNHPFLTNKANFQKSQINVSDLLISDYEQIYTWSSGKNKANTNPIQTQFKAKTNPIQTQFKPKQSQFIAAWTEKSRFQKRYLLVKCMIDNCLSKTLFPLTSCPAGRYNGACSKISFFPETIERVWK